MSSNESEPTTHVVPGPVSFVQLIRASWSLYSARLLPLLGLFLMLFLSFSIVAASLTILFAEAEIDDASTAVAQPLSLLVFTLICTLAAGLGSIIATDGHLGIQTNIRRAYSSLGRRVRDLVFCSFAAALITIIFLLFGAFAMGIAFVLGPPVLVHAVALEQKPLGDAWRRTKELLAGHALRVFVYLIVASLVVSLFQLSVFVGGFNLAEPIEDRNLEFMVRNLIIGFVNGTTLPLLVTTGLVVYFDLRSRLDGLTYEQLRTERTTPTPPSANQD